jgi:23S rRNA (uridine2552-2'-O)-methyltransferase
MAANRSSGGSKGKGRGGRPSGGRESGGGAAGSSRGLTQRVKTARGRKLGSTRWLQRQLNDPYVQEAQRLGYRSRAAFKLAQIDDKFALLKPGQRVVDLGAAPGGWLQVAAERLKLTDPSKGSVLVGLDLLEIEPVAGAVILQGDFNDDDAPARLREPLGGPADVVLSDMAVATTGHAATDHLRTVALAEMAVAFAADVLAPGGSLAIKVFQGSDEPALFEQLRALFDNVRRFKPKASRSDSVEMFIVASGFKGGDNGG